MSTGQPRARAVRGVVLGAVLLVTIVAVGVASCGGGGGSGSGSASRLVVFADSVLRTPFTRSNSRKALAAQTNSVPWMGNVYTSKVKATFTYATTKLLAARIRKGARPDLLAGDATLLDQLYTAGLVQEPIRFTTRGQDQIFLVKRGDSVHILRLGNVERRGVRLAIGTPTSGLGRDTSRALGRLPTAQRRAILANVRLREPSARAILDDILRGKVDAGFVHGSEVPPNCCKQPQKDSIYSIGLPPSTQLAPKAYSVAIVDGTTHLDDANTFIYGLLDGNSAGNEAFQAGGFGAAPPIAHRPRKPPVITSKGV